MKIYKYKNYEEYVSEQTRANVKKLKAVWVRKDVINKICKENFTASAILCHGTRNAREQEYFKDHFKMAEIIGTEISHTASQFPMTIQHDFHEPKEEWLNKFNIVYSNSFDHSYDPQKCIQTWADQLLPNGSLYIEWAWGENNLSRSTDPLELSEQELLELATNVGLTFIGAFKNKEKNSKIYRFKR